MPKLVDHDTRRASLARAAAEVIAGHGLDATGLRQVAQASALTTGAVTHYFSSKAELIDAAYAAAMERLFERQAGGIGPATTPAAVAAQLAQFLPGDDDSVRDWRLWLAFSARALVDPALASRHRQFYARIIAGVAAEIAGGGIDAATAADALVAVIDGLGVRMLLEPGEWPPARVEATLVLMTRILFEGGRQ